MSLQNLPPETVLEVIQNLRNPDMSSLALVNRNCYVLATDRLYKRDARENYGSALIHGIINGNMSTIKRSLDAGADIQYIFEYGVPECPPAVCGAAAAGNPEIFNDLIQAGAPLNYRMDGLSPLQIAAGRGHIKIVKILLHLGVELQTTEENSPIGIACAKGHNSVVEALLADPRIKSSRAETWGLGPLETAVKNGHVQIVETLLAHGVKIRPPSPLMHIAVVYGGLSMLEFLLKRQEIDINVLFSRRTALHRAVEQGQDGMVEILVRDPRIDLDLTGCGHTPLIEAESRNDRRICAILIDAGANPKAVDQPWGSW